MNILYSIYFALPNFGRIGLIGKAINRMLSTLLKKGFDVSVPSYLARSSASASFGLNTVSRKEKYIVSLTSFPARIKDVWVPIDIILRQSFKPDKVILWLARTQFPDGALPENLLNLTSRGLTIEYCDEDLRSHKKYFYVMQRYPDANVITMDDDLYYDRYFLENLVAMHRAYPNCIATNRAHRFTFDEDGGLRPYRHWKHNVTDKGPSHLLVSTGGAGTLYPPGSLHNSVFKKEVFKRICFHADDLWLKAMAFVNDTPVVTNDRYNKDFVTITSTQKEKLVSTNVLAGGNDKQLKDVMEYFNVTFFK